MRFVLMLASEIDHLLYHFVYDKHGCLRDAVMGAKFSARCCNQKRSNVTGSAPALRLCHTKCTESPATARRAWANIVIVL